MILIKKNNGNETIGMTYQENKRNKSNQMSLSETAKKTPSACGGDELVK